MADTKNDFSKGNVVENILKLAVPMTLAQLINVLYNIVDRIYIGRIPENATMALTGLGLCLPIISIVIAFANLFGMGGAPLCSIERGRGNEKEAEKIMGNS
ncbi:MAG TPA: MATE family efflux transporter, partial [Clostridium sp.]|nr:MATE family efflux transporter [Clostridium sp.]